MCNLRTIPCPDCGGDRGFSFPVDFDRQTGALIEDWQACRYCGATGGVEIELMPVELDDLAEFVGEVA